MPYVLSHLNQTGIPPLLQGIESYEQWTAKLSAIRATWLDYIGELPARVPVQLKVHSESKELTHTRLHIEYDTVYDDAITAYLLIPNERAFKHPGQFNQLGHSGQSDQPGQSGYPAIMALHPTHELGKDDIATLSGRENRKYAIELVERGYVVLVPDALTAGERIYPGKPSFHSGPFYEKHPEWSTVAKNVIDHMQGLDVLCSLDIVNPHAIGAIGHSFGGYNSYFLAGLDDRIKAVVSSCGFSPFTGDPDPQHWGHRNFPYTHIPKISADLQQDQIPFEFHEIVVLMAPTPFFSYAGQDDHIFPHWKSVAEGMLELSRLYRWLGKEDHFKSFIGAGGHDFPEEIRMLAYSFLDYWLKKV